MQNIVLQKGPIYGQCLNFERFHQPSEYLQQIIYNKMLAMQPSYEQIFIKFPKNSHKTSIYQSCMNGQAQKDLMACCRIKKPTQQKISIKALLRNQRSSQSCSNISQVYAHTAVQQNHLESFSKQDNLSYARQSSCYMNYDRGLIRTNSMQEEIRLPAKQIRISYPNYQHELPCQPSKNIIGKLQVPAQTIDNPEREMKDTKKGGFNEFLSFGPKNAELFRKINSLEINHIQSDIVEQTERTEQAERERVQVKRLTKTCSQVQIEREIKKFSTSTLYNQNASRQFKTSQLFTSIKHAETMKNGLSSDHESEVVQNFESLIEKVKSNRLQNWSIAS